MESTLGANSARVMQWIRGEWVTAVQARSTEVHAALLWFLVRLLLANERLQQRGTSTEPQRKSAHTLDQVTSLTRSPRRSRHVATDVDDRSQLLELLLEIRLELFLGIGAALLGEFLVRIQCEHASFNEFAHSEAQLVLILGCPTSLAHVGGGAGGGGGRSCCRISSFVRFRGVDR